MLPQAEQVGPASESTRACCSMALSLTYAASCSLPHPQAPSHNASRHRPRCPARAHNAPLGCGARACALMHGTSLEQLSALCAAHFHTPGCCQARMWRRCVRTDLLRSAKRDAFPLTPVRRGGIAGWKDDLAHFVRSARLYRLGLAYSDGLCDAWCVPREQPGSRAARRCIASCMRRGWCCGGACGGCVRARSATLLRIAVARYAAVAASPRCPYAAPPPLGVEFVSRCRTPAALAPLSLADTQPWLHGPRSLLTRRGSWRVSGCYRYFSCTLNASRRFTALHARSSWRFACWQPLRRRCRATR